ncbi:MAG: hypothetical protein QNJ00_16750 [Woeseiaceae bacterium]|nr:hypothetical protein [Woeseiaceae bacterium]
MTAITLLLVLAACEPESVCDYQVAASSDGKTRVALLVDTSEQGIDKIRSSLETLQFPNSNICTLSGADATSEATRIAVAEFAALSNSNAVRFAYLSAAGSVVADDNADEPDEYDETLVFTDGDGSGKGEIRDDELDEWLRSIASRSSASLIAINAGVHSASLAADQNPMTRTDLLRSRNVASADANGGDGAAWLHDGGGENHVVLAPGPGAAGVLFQKRVMELLNQLGVHTPTYEQLVRRFTLQVHADGLQPDARGGGSGSVFELHRTRLVPLALGEARLTVSIRSEALPGGLASGERAVAADILEGFGGAVDGDGLADFEISRRDDGKYILRGSGGRARNAFESLDMLADILTGHRLQVQLSQLRGNDSQLIPDFSSVDVSLRRNSQQLPCATGAWDAAAPGEVQDIPLCAAWYVAVNNLRPSVPLFMTVLVLSSDGTTIAIPGTAGRPVNGEILYDAPQQVLGAGPPIDVVDRVVVIGSTERIDINAILDGRAAAPDGSKWTIGTRLFRSVANSGFVAADELSQREYTIKNFDIRPYLPDDDETALSKFLRKADSLARSSVEDGYSYKQHGWRHATDTENLALGIDCSRSIWFAFTRAGLPYNSRDDRYLTTADMVSNETPMGDEFESCALDEDYQIGDILVYRSSERGDGHVVAVIDPARRIAWGSHGWDGNVRAELALEPDTGVEYQKIRVKQDWRRWDRSDMELKKCWRYRRFSEELAAGRGSTGSRILNVTCSERECRF